MNPEPDEARITRPEQYLAALRELNAILRAKPPKAAPPPEPPAASQPARD
jgi:hypothetical protein